MAKVLVIDDDSLILEVMRDMLERRGHLVSEAKDGQQGVERFLEDPQDVVITDILMPVKTGFDVIRELREHYPDVKVIAMASLGHPLLAKAIDAGAQRTLAKPFHLDGLLDLVEEVLGL